MEFHRLKFIFILQLIFTSNGVQTFNSGDDKVNLIGYLKLLSIPVYMHRTNLDYRGRIAPTPTGYLHLGHARTFWTAMSRARKAGGKLIYRCEDLDRTRCTAEYSEAAIEDMCWFGCSWDEGPDISGPFAPYRQSARMSFFLEAWKALKVKGFIYPCNQSRKDLANATLAPHEGLENGEPIYPKNLRPPTEAGKTSIAPGNSNWRFRVPDHKKVEFTDAIVGLRSFVCQRDFGDFIVWRKDGVPAYELAVVVDDAAMRISEVVRGEDLLLSTARQLLLYEALDLEPPQFCHLPLVYDSSGKRLAKRHQSLSLRDLRAAGRTPEALRNSKEWHLVL